MASPFVLQRFQVGQQIYYFRAVQLEFGHRMSGFDAFGKRFLDVLDRVAVMKNCGG